MIVTMKRLLLFCIGCLLITSYVQAEPVYELRAGDKLKVTVFGHSDLSGEFVINDDGQISLPLINDVIAAGATARDLEAAITDKLRPDYLKRPRVTVEVLSYKPIYVLGEVNNPGAIPYASDLTLISAIAQAGGYTYRAKTSKVVVTRARGDNKQVTNASPDTVLYPGDVVEVPERYF